MTFLCPVCGYDQLSRPPERHLICPCCGTQFGYHDYALTHDELRQQWISRGAAWHSKRVSIPQEWSAYTQLVNAGIMLSSDEKRVLKKDEPQLRLNSFVLVSMTGGFNAVTSSTTVGIRNAFPELGRRVYA